jgi:hypothetical protein
MSYINMTAYVDGKLPKTKKALKEAVRDDPESVTLEAQSHFDRDTPSSPIYIPKGVTVQVCGPDPHRDRRWYASITFDGNEVKCS